VWDTVTGNPVGRPFEGHKGAVYCVVFSPNGKHIVSGSYDRTIRVWDIMTGNIKAGPFGMHGGSFNSVSFSPNGRYIASASADGKIRLWDAATGDAVGEPFEGHTDWAHSVAFSPNGKYIVSGSADHTIRMWPIQDLVVSPPETLPSLISVPPMLQNGFLLQDGWALRPEQELLFWVPPANRGALYSPRNTFVIGRNPTIIDFSNYVHGEAWEECKTSASF
jgi:WD40 repeat protein